MNRTGGRGSSSLLTAPLDDPLEVIAAVEKLTKYVLGAAAFVIITKRLPTWIKIAMESDVDIRGPLIKLLLFFIVLFIAWRILRDFWQGGRRLEIQAKMELKLNDYSRKIRGWAQDFVGGIQDMKIPGYTQEKRASRPISDISLTKRMKSKREERPWIFLSQLDGLWEKLAGKRNGRSSRRNMPKIQDSDAALAAVNEWDRVRLMEIVRAHQGKHMKATTPNVPTIPPSQMDQTRTEDELTLDYYRRANQMRQERYKRDVELVQDASNYQAQHLPSYNFSISNLPHPTSFHFRQRPLAKFPQWQRPSS